MLTGGERGRNGEELRITGEPEDTVFINLKRFEGTRRLSGGGV
jgi:hypothetical protein